MSSIQNQYDVEISPPTAFPTNVKTTNHVSTSYPSFDQRNISDLTSTSIESSPTTTISTVDDSSATEPSPGSSPESPPPSRFASGMVRPRTAHETGTPFFELRKQSLPKKGRNLKNLAVNTSRGPPGRASSTTSLLQAPDRAANLTADLSSMASPDFVKPPSPPRRRPSNFGLTLLTPASNRAPPQEVRLSIPTSPSIGRPSALRHFQSSPSLPLISGLRLIDRPYPQQGFANSDLSTMLSPILSPTEPPRRAFADDDDQNFDVPLSREDKPEAYPDGPICIYEPFVDLYLEPSAEQCRKYDVVLNVASEVRNPLIDNDDAQPADFGIRIDGGGGIQYVPKRPLKQSEGTYIPSANGSPTTPKAVSSGGHLSRGASEMSSAKDPEYIHVPWEHNTDIVPELLRLVNLIDERVKQGKRVLIHCQCGVSRSASLVVAYGLFKDPKMSVQEAYDSVKKRSKWIGPNMNLIMQLQEFRTSLTRGGTLQGNRGLSPITPSSAFDDWKLPFSPFKSGPNAIDLFSAAIGRITVDAPSLSPVSPGPSSAPSSQTHPDESRIPPVTTQHARAISAVKQISTNAAATAFVDTSGHVVSVSKIPELPRSAYPPNQSYAGVGSEPLQKMDELSSSQGLDLPMAPLRPRDPIGPKDSFGVMSPTSTEFSSLAFDRTALLASLGMGSVHSAETPRRSLSLRSRTQQGLSLSSGVTPISRLRGKISAPSLRERQQFQDMQAQIKAALPRPCDSMKAGFSDEDALLSPRVTEFTKNPFSWLHASPQRQSPENQITPTPLLSVDPRSPAQVGVSPITRNIMDVL